MDMTIPLAVAVDRIGQIKATIASLKADQEALESLLIESGLPVVEGAMYRASVSHCDGRVVTDWRTIAERFEPSRQLVAAHTKHGDAYDVVRVSARKTS
jgi:hypothetical protein